MSRIFWQRHGLERANVAKMYLAGGEFSTIAAGGALQPEQQLDYLNGIRCNSTLLGPVFPGGAPRAAGPQFDDPASGQIGLMPQGTVAGFQDPFVRQGGPGIRFINVSSGATSGTIEGFLAGGHVVEADNEATASTSPAPTLLTPRTRDWKLDKLHMFQEWSQEIAFQSILEDRFSEFLFGAFFPVAANDLELLALYGNKDTVGTDARSRLLRANDGWFKQMDEEATPHDHGGAFASSSLFLSILRKYRRAASLYMARQKYLFCNPAIIDDWIEVMQNRGAGALEATAALGGRAMAPYGLQMWPVPLIGINDAIVQAAAAVGARVEGVAKYDQFRFMTDAFQLTLNVNAAGAVTVVFPHQENSVKRLRSLSLVDVCNRINEALVTDYASETYKGVARPTINGTIELISPSTGAAQSIAITDGGSSCHSILGLSLGTTSGVAANGGGSTYNGTRMFLTMPDNLRMYVSTAPAPSNNRGFYQSLMYDQKRDMFRYDARMFADFVIEVPEAIINVTGVRVANAGESAV